MSTEIGDAFDCISLPRFAVSSGYHANKLGLSAVASYLSDILCKKN